MNFIISIISENGRIWKINSIDFIDYQSGLVLDMVQTEDIIQHLSPQLL